MSFYFLIIKLLIILKLPLVKIEKFLSRNLQIKLLKCFEYIFQRTSSDDSLIQLSKESYPCNFHLNTLSPITKLHNDGTTFSE